MRIIVFMGHHKVGSTSLQRFLSANWLRLARAGILYPAVEAESVAGNLAAAVEDRDNDPHGMVALREPHNALAFKIRAEIRGFDTPPWHPDLPSTDEMFRLIRWQMQALRPRHVVLCSEVMANFGADSREAVQRLHDAFPDAEFTILATLRRPDDYLTSWHIQRISRFRNKVLPLRDGGAEPYWRNIHFDYRLMLEAWLEVFGPEALNVRDYADVMRAGGSIPDFIARSGIAFPNRLAEPPVANASLPLPLVEIARRGDFALEDDVSFELVRLLQTLAPQLTLPGNAEVEMYGPEVRARLVENFAPIGGWLAERFGRTPFFEGHDDMARLRPVPELEAAQSALEQLRALPGLAAIALRERAPLTAATLRAREAADEAVKNARKAEWARRESLVRPFAPVRKRNTAEAARLAEEHVQRTAEALEAAEAARTNVEKAIDFLRSVDLAETVPAPAPAAQ